MIGSFEKKLKIREGRATLKEGVVQPHAITCEGRAVVAR
jgi:hypothetical protein